MAFDQVVQLFSEIIFRQYWKSSLSEFGRLIDFRRALIHGIKLIEEPVGAKSFENFTLSVPLVVGGRSYEIHFEIDKQGSKVVPEGGAGSL